MSVSFFSGLLFVLLFSSQLWRSFISIYHSNFEVKFLIFLYYIFYILFILFYLFYITFLKFLKISNAVKIILPLFRKKGEYHFFWFDYSKTIAKYLFLNYFIFRETARLYFSFKWVVLSVCSVCTFGNFIALYHTFSNFGTLTYTFSGFCPISQPLAHFLTFSQVFAHFLIPTLVFGTLDKIA